MSADYYTIEATLSNLPPPPPPLPNYTTNQQQQQQQQQLFLMTCRLVSIDNRRIATEKDFDPKTGTTKEQQHQRYKYSRYYD